MSSKYGGISKEQCYKNRTKREKEFGFVKFHLTESELKSQPSENKVYDDTLFYEKLFKFMANPSIEDLAWLVSHMDYGDIKSTIEQNRIVKKLCYDIATKSSDSSTSS